MSALSFGLLAGLNAFGQQVRRTLGIVAGGWREHGAALVLHRAMTGHCPAGKPESPHGWCAG